MANHAHDDHGHAHGHDEHASGFHASMKDYVIGFILSVILTAIPFWLVMSGALHSASATGLVIMGFAAVQIVVHMVYFLHMSPKVEGGQNLLALIFTLVLVGIVLSGSLWVMYHLNHNMMPMPATMEGMS
jgi:cytochrome o ubiquinol oxidase operon protein cyoD